MCNKFKDATDEKIYEIAQEGPISLTDMSRKIGKTYMTTKYRVWDLERDGYLKIEKGRNRVTVHAGENRA